MEEIGYRAHVESILTEDAVDLLATKPRTPLRTRLHLALSFDAG